MKNLKNFTKAIVTFVVMVTLTVGMITPVAAQTALQQKNASAEAVYQQVRQAYQSALSLYKTARQDFMDAKDKYKQFSKAEKAKNKAAIEQKARLFLGKAVSAVIGYLETLKAKVESARAVSDTDKQKIAAEVDQDIKWLQDRQAKISTADATQLKTEAKAVQNYWSNIRVKVKRITGEILAAQINFLIDKAQNLAGDVRGKVKALRAAGKDTTQLETWLDGVDQKIATAKEKYNLAQAKFKAISSLADADRLFREGNQFIKDAEAYIKGAQADLIKIIKEMKNINTTAATSTETQKQVLIEGQGKLTATGNGSAVLTGSGVIEVRGLDGTLTITDNSASADIPGDAIVPVGDATITVNGLGNKTTLASNKWQYTGSGKANISGSNLVVELNGTKIDLFAKGTGSATLTGSGNYQTCGKKCSSGVWIQTGKTIPFSASVE